jgi:nucleotide-binding universal stress UspA family protein
VSDNELEAAMTVRPAILCPIDYSGASAASLRYAAAIAEHFVTRLIVLNVEDPLLTAAMDLSTGVRWSRERSEEEMAAFVTDAFGTGSPTLAMCEYDVAHGKPAAEVLRLARERSCDLIVMSTHGLTGIRKLVLGSTTERVLRETTIPVLLTPPVNPGPIRVEDAKRLIDRIVVPIDLSPATPHQADVARGLAEALGVSLIFVHVIEPPKSRARGRINLTALEAQREAAAKDRLDAVLTSLPARLRAESLIVHGVPAEEIARIVRDRRAGFVIIGLHDSPFLGPRMGSVTYKLLCLSPTLTLALPPKRVQHSSVMPLPPDSIRRGAVISLVQ